MKNIDLIFFAQNKRKISKELLGPHPRVKPLLFLKVMLGHYVDLFIISILTLFLIGIYTQSIDHIFNFNGLKFNQNDQANNSLIIFIFPTMIFNYFFFSYFLNHGQSYGMYVMKKRLRMKSKSFTDSSFWSLHSSLLCLSLGLSYFPKKSRWKNLKEHDYLYHNLVVTNESNTIKLIDLIPYTSSRVEENNKYLDKAS